MKYMLLMNATRSNWESFGTLKPQELQAHMEFMMRLNAELAASKELVDAQGLSLPTMAKTVRAQPGAAPVVTDGPFPETKEFLAGYWIVDVDTPRAGVRDRRPKLRERPAAVASRSTSPIEVRQVMSAPPECDAGRVTRREHLLRELAPQVLGAVMRRYSDFAAAEDAVQEALLAAAAQWPREGCPTTRAAGSIHVASRRLTDHVRARDRPAAPRGPSRRRRPTPANSRRPPTRRRRDRRRHAASCSSCAATRR